MKKYIIILIASVMATAATAQSITPQEERAFYQKVYTLVNEYAQYITVDDEEMKERFLYLFKDENVMVYNDLMSLSFEPTLKVEEYAELLHKASSLSVKVKNLRKGQISDEGTTWTMPIEMEKSISYINTCGTLFDSETFFRKDYKLVATVAVNKQTGRYYFTSITSKDALLFPQNYKVLEKADERDNKLTVDGEIVSFNQFGQVVLRPGAKIKYLGADVDRITDKDACDAVIHAKYNDKSFRVRVHGGFALGGFNKLSGGDNMTASGNGEVSFGVDLGYIFPSTGRLQVGVFAGLGISSNTLEMAYQPTGTSVITGLMDGDGDTYNRYFEMTSGGEITQKMSATNFAIPVYADFEYRVGPELSVYADLGIKAYMAGGSNSATIDKYFVWGEYNKSEYGGTLIIGKNDEVLGEKPEVEWEGFGGPYGGSIDVDEIDVASKTAIDVLLGLGLRYNIGKSIAVDAGVQYLTGSNSWENSATNKDIFKRENGTDTVNLLRLTDGIKHSGLKANISLIFKF